MDDILKTTSNASIDELVKKFWKEVEAKGGEINYDFSNPDHVAVYNHSLGLEHGEMEMRFPHLHQLILAQAAPAMKKAESASDPSKLGFSDAFKISCIGIDKNEAGGLHVANKHNGYYMDEKDTITECFDFIDMEDNERIVFSDSVICWNSRDIEYDLELPCGGPTGNLVKSYQTRCTFSGYATDEDGGGLTATAKMSTDSAMGETSYFKDVCVDDPKKKYSTTGNDIIVCYEREGTDRESKPDYVYKKVVVDRAARPQTISIHMPFSGKATVIDNVLIKSVDETSFKMSVRPTEKTVGGEVFYDKSQKNFKFTLGDPVEYTYGDVKSKAYKSVSWDFTAAYNKEDAKCHDWGTILTADHVQNNTQLAFYALIRLDFVDGRQGKIGRLLNPGNIIVQSSMEGSTKKQTQNIKFIYIWWGCLGKDSKVLMADGSQKIISHILPGDRVRTADGISVEVKDVITGPEESLIYVETAKGRNILVTDSHPIMTLRGAIKAGELNAADEISTKDGFESVKYLYRKEYRDTVYNLIFEQKNAIVCNDIVVGDFISQQETSFAAKPQKLRTQNHDDPVALEFQALAKLKNYRHVCNGKSENAPARPYFGCRFDTESGSYATAEGLAAAAFKDRKFTIDVWVNIQGASGSILAQDEGFLLGADYDTLYFRHPSIGELRCKAINRLLRSWNHVFVSYDGEELLMGMNGLALCSMSCEGETLIDGGAVEIGGCLDGFIRRVLIYNDAVPAALLRKRLFQNIYGKKLDNLKAFIDFNTGVMRDLGPARLTVRGENGCAPQGLTNCYLPSKGKYASACSGSHINPGGFTTGEFGIYIKFFPGELYGRKAVLLSNGCFGESDSLILYLRETEGKVAPYLYMGGKDYQLASEIPRERWTDLAVSYGDSSNEIDVFMDGALVNTVACDPFKRKCRGDVKIGNGFDLASQGRDYSCGCYFAYGAIFNRIFKNRQIQNLYKDQPFLFDQNLVAVYSFENDCGVELISGEALLLDEANMAILAGSVDNMNISQYHYQISGELKPVGEKAEAVLRMMTVYYKEMFGLAVDTLNDQLLGAVCSYIDDKLLCRDAFSDLFNCEPDYDGLRCALIEWDAGVSHIFAGLTYADSEVNRQYSLDADLIGIGDCAASSSCVAGVSRWISDYGEDDDFSEVFDKMLTALQ